METALTQQPAYLIRILLSHGDWPENVPVPDVADTVEAEEGILHQLVEAGRLRWDRIMDCTGGLLEMQWWRQSADRGEWVTDEAMNRFARDHGVALLSMKDGSLRILGDHPTKLDVVETNWPPGWPGWQFHLCLPTLLASVSMRQPPLALQVAEAGNRYQTDLADVSPRTTPLTEILRRARDSDITDVHIEPLGEHRGSTVRFRQDGCLRHEVSLNHTQSNWLMRCIREEGGIPADREHLWHDCWLKECGDRDASWVRVSWIPSMEGPSIVMRRVVDSNRGGDRDFPEMEAPVTRRWQEILRGEGGLMIICGPTGSGKSTTARGMLQWFDPGKNKVIAFEDPVEVKLTGVQHVPVGRAARASFAAAFRASLRQGPDLMFFGELRDEETAVAVVEAALSGHRVLTTMHAGSARACVSRLLEFGVSERLLGSLLRGILSQRLLRMRCVACGDESPASGCTVCRGLRYRGRKAVFEHWEPGDGGGGRRNSDTLEFADALSVVRAAGWTDEEEIVRVFGGRYCGLR